MGLERGWLWRARGAAPDVRNRLIDAVVLRGEPHASTESGDLRRATYWLRLTKMRLARNKGVNPVRSQDAALHGHPLFTGRGARWRGLLLSDHTGSSPLPGAGASLAFVAL